MSQLWGPEAVEQLISDVLEKGFEPPFYAVAVGTNEAMVYAKWTARDEGGFDTTFLAEHYPDGEDVGLKTPVTFMIVDRLGQSERAVIVRGDQT